MSQYNNYKSYNEESDDYAWIVWFHRLKGNEFFCVVEESYLRDPFNLTGLSSSVRLYSQAIDTILEDCEMSQDSPHLNEVESDAELLYGLIHARYITTSAGLAAMRKKYKEKEFGLCPRKNCQNQPVLPVGLSDTHGIDHVHVYCPKCEEVYKSTNPRHQYIDGAYFGTTFPHLFFLTYPTEKPAKTTVAYEPRVFGYKLHKSAYIASLTNE